MGRGMAGLVTVILLISLTACQGDVSEKIHKRYGNLQSYTALISVTVTGNKGAETYEISQSWREPDQYRAEVTSPARMQGTVSVISGETMWFRGGGAPAVRMERGMAEAQTDYLFLPDFLADFYSQEPLPVLEENPEGLALLTAPRRGGRYRFVQNLWIDVKTLLPVRLETCDAQGNEMIRVEYRDFVPNARVEDAVFLP